MNMTYQQPPSKWETVAEGNRFPTLKMGLDPKAHNVLPGEIIEARIEGMNHFDSVYEGEYKGRGTALTLVLHKVKKNQALNNQVMVFFLNGNKRTQFLAKKYGINDWVRISYEGRDMTARGNPPHIFTVQGVKTNDSTFIEDDMPGGSQGQGLKNNNQNSQYGDGSQGQEMKNFAAPPPTPLQNDPMPSAVPTVRATIPGGDNRFQVRVKR